jgi:predicted RNase H-like HicB family nuclease
MNAVNERLLDELVQLPYATTVTLEDAEGQPWYVAYNVELVGCMATGTTWQEAIQNLREARRDYLSSYIENGWDVPMPAQIQLAQAPSGIPVRPQLVQLNVTLPDVHIIQDPVTA